MPFKSDLVFHRVGWLIALAVPVIFLLLFFFWPAGSLLARALGDWGRAIEVVSQPRTWRIVGQTIGMALASTAGSLLLGIPGAYVLYRLRIPFRRALRAFVTAPFVLPTVVVGAAFRALFDDGGALGFLGLGQTTAAVILAMIFFNYAVVVRTVGTMWASLKDMTPAARMLGASPARAFVTVTLPQLRPAIAAAAGLVFLLSSTSFGLVQTLGRPGYGTLESEIYVQTTAYLNLDVAAVLSILQLVIVAAALLVSNSLTSRALTVTPSKAVALSRNDVPAFAITAGALLFLAVPILALVSASLKVQGEWSFHNYRLLTEAGSGLASGVAVFEALEHSVRIALDAAILALLVGVILALALSRRVTSPFLAAGQRLLDGATALPLGISAVTVGLGFLVTWGARPGVSTAYLVPAAQAVVALPFVVRALVPILRAIDPRMRQAAATLGASPNRVLLTIDMPIMARGLSVAFGFAFAISLGEFGATAFLASPDYLTLPVLIERLLARPGTDNYGMALAASVILALATSVVVFLADVLRPRGAKGVSF